MKTEKRFNIVWGCKWRQSESWAYGSNHPLLHNLIFIWKLCEDFPEALRKLPPAKFSLKVLLRQPESGFPRLLIKCVQIAGSCWMKPFPEAENYLRKQNSCQTSRHRAGGLLCSRVTREDVKVLPCKIHFTVPWNILSQRNWKWYKSLWNLSLLWTSQSPNNHMLGKRIKWLVVKIQWIE